MTVNRMIDARDVMEHAMPNQLFIVETFGNDDDDYLIVAPTWLEAFVLWRRKWLEAREPVTLEYMMGRLGASVSVWSMTVDVSSVEAGGHAWDTVVPLHNIAPDDNSLEVQAIEAALDQARRTRPEGLDI